MPKLQSVAELARSLEATGFPPRGDRRRGDSSGVLPVEEVLTDGSPAGYFSAEDFITGMAGRRTGSGVEVPYVRAPGHGCASGSWWRLGRQKARVLAVGVDGGAVQPYP